MSYMVPLLRAQGWPGGGPTVPTKALATEPTRAPGTESADPLIQKALLKKKNTMLIGTSAKKTTLG